MMDTTEDVVSTVSALHERLRAKLPWLRALSTKVAQVHGARQPDLVELDGATEQLALGVAAHLELEDEALLPALRGEAAAEEELAGLAADHLELRRLLDDVRVAADHFRAPEWACLTYRRLMNELAAFETDLLRSIHLEHHAIGRLPGGVGAVR
jgi:regulator of cell morphogenesis and NO signaling